MVYLNDARPCGPLARLASSLLGQTQVTSSPTYYQTGGGTFSSGSGGLSPVFPQPVVFTSSGQQIPQPVVFSTSGQQRSLPLSQPTNLPRVNSVPVQPLQVVGFEPLYKSLLRNAKYPGQYTSYPTVLNPLPSNPNPS